MNRTSPLETPVLHPPEPVRSDTRRDRRRDPDDGGTTLPRRRLPSLWRGPQADPSWARPALLVLLMAAAVLYLWDLSASGWANSYYAAAVQAGSTSWKAFFFGSLDAGNVITVDKPAFFLWPMDITARIFGMNSWSILVPQALEGVAAVALLAATVRRVCVGITGRVDGPVHVAGLAVGAMLALTPVATLMFRYNNPDAMLTLLVVSASYAVVRALETASTRWLVVAGFLVGLGCITKMGQALLVVPALALAYLIAAPTSWRRRIGQLLGSGAAMVAGAGWWIAIVELWPASSRPYIGGSTTNSILELALGYNGLGRLFGSSSGSSFGSGAGMNAMAALGGSSSTGPTRLFTGDLATEISWLLPAALLALVAGLWLTRRAPRTDLARAGLILFGGSLLVTGVVFSTMQGIFHEYYTIALAPGIAGLLAVTGLLLWRARAAGSSRAIAAVIVAVTAGWDYHLLAGTPSYLPWLQYAVVALAVVAVAGLLFGPALRQFAVVGMVAALLTGATGTGAYAVTTAGRPHTGSIPTSGPATSAMARVGALPIGASGMTLPKGAKLPSGVNLPQGMKLPPGMTLPSGTQAPSGSTAPGSGGTSGAGTSDTATGMAETMAEMMRGMATSTKVDAKLVSMLTATTSTWAAATVRADSAAALQLASDKAVISIGGFSGNDAAPTLKQFTTWVAQGKIHYYVTSGGAADGTTGAQIESWVKGHYTATAVGGYTVYDLTRPSTSTS